MAPIAPLFLRVWPFERPRTWLTAGGFASNDEDLFAAWMKVEYTLHAWGMSDDDCRRTVREAIEKELSPVDILALSIEFYCIEIGDQHVEEEPTEEVQTEGSTEG